MLVVIPLSVSDAHLIPDFAAALQHFGPYRNHEAVISPTAAVLTEAEQLKTLLASVFPTVAIVPTNYEGTGWPLAPNRHFRECAKWVQDNRQLNPWYFFEMDNTPIKKGWLNDMEAAYTASNKDYMGAVVPTRVFNGATFATEGSHMVGTGIYPWNAYGRSIILKTCDIQYIWAQTPLKPFDVQMAEEIMPYVRATLLIAHRWRTVNYRYDNGSLVCDDQPGNPPGTSHAAPVPEEALVVHGCRDGSLARLVTEAGADVVAALARLNKLPEYRAATGGNVPVFVDQLTVLSVPEPVIPDRETPPWTPPPVAPPKPPKPELPPLKDRILAIVRTNSRRVGQLAKELKVSPAAIQQAVVRNGAELQIIPPGWVKPRILEEIL